MMVWFLLIGTLLALFAAGLLYISFRAAHFPVVQKLARGKRGPARLICLVFFAAVTALLWLAWNMMNAVVCLIHLVLFWLICDLAAWLLAKLRKDDPRPGRAGAVALVLCVLWLAGGWVADHHVWVKEYAFSSEKVDRSIRLVQITDSHVGATFDGEGFGRHMQTVNELHPDLVLITGDFVDDDTSRADMLRACDALGQLQEIAREKKDTERVADRFRFFAVDIDQVGSGLQRIERNPDRNREGRPVQQDRDKEERERTV